MKILTAEDNSTFRRIAEVILRKWGYEVTAACNGEEAWQALQTEDPPELFIIDWMMPRMDGGNSAAGHDRFKRQHTPISSCSLAGGRKRMLF